MLVKAFGFLLLPLYTLYLETDQYGIINIINSFNAMATYIVSFSLYSAVMRYFVEYGSDTERFKRFVGSITTFVILSGLFFFTALFLLRNSISGFLFENITFFPYVLIGISTLIFISIYNVHQNLMLAMQSGKKLTLLNLIFFVLQVILNIMFVVFLDMKAVGILLAGLITNIIYFIYVFIDYYKMKILWIGIDYKLIKESLLYSIPIIPHNISTYLASFASKVILNKSESLSEVGVYGVASQFGSLIDIVQFSVSKAFRPWVFDNLKNLTNEAKEEVRRFSYYLLLFYSFMYIVIGLFSQEVVVLLLPKSYVLAWTVIPIIVVGFSIKSIYYFYINLLFYNKQASRILFVATLTGSMLDIILAYLLIPVIGMYGSAVAFTFAKIIIVTIIVIVSRKYNDVKYSVLKMLLIIIPSLLFMGLGLIFSYSVFLDQFDWFNVLYKVIILVTYLLIIFLTNKDLPKKVLLLLKRKKPIHQKDNESLEVLG